MLWHLSCCVSLPEVTEGNSQSQQTLHSQPWGWFHETDVLHATSAPSSHFHIHSTFTTTELTEIHGLLSEEQVFLLQRSEALIFTVRSEQVMMVTRVLLQTQDSIAFTTTRCWRLWLAWNRSLTFTVKHLSICIKPPWRILADLWPLRKSHLG